MDGLVCSKTPDRIETRVGFMGVESRKMQRIRMIIEYDGSGYHGFQVQENAHTIQREIESKLLQLTGHPTRITAAGRTDAGVHARGQVIAFDTVATIPPFRFSAALNSRLPPDIRVLESSPAAGDFHPRFQASKKTYSYLIYRSQPGRVFFRNYAFCNTELLDVKAMQEGARLLVGRQNFKAFCASGSGVKNFERQVTKCLWEEIGDILHFCIEADGFLYKMVRNIVGTLLEIGRGDYDPEYIQKIIAGQDRNMAGVTAPPQGLYLMNVCYE